MVDVILRGDIVVDGAGRPRFVADVAVGGDWVAAINPGRAR
jgi:N-acyl-D-aspartate/D-glutamate deacylase